MSHEMQVLMGVVRGAMAGVLLVMFIGMWIWVFARGRQAALAAAARLPLEEDRTGVDRP